MLMCLNCGSTNVEWDEREYVETHGLDCGPYERWTESGWYCRSCGALEDTVDHVPDEAEAPYYEEEVAA